MSATIVMGVSGCGKSTVASLLASRLHGEFLDADDFHPIANKQKMASGIPLTDDDRWGWLDALNAELKSRESTGTPVFLACSALRQVYRDRLAAGLPTLQFIYLRGSKELIWSRLSARHDHFMPTALLDSQFATLEEPVNAITVEIDGSPETIVEKILLRLQKIQPNGVS